MPGKSSILSEVREKVPQRAVCYGSRQDSSHSSKCVCVCVSIYMRARIQRCPHMRRMLLPCDVCSSTETATKISARARYFPDVRFLVCAARTFASRLYLFVTHIGANGFSCFRYDFKWDYLTCIKYLILSSIWVRLKCRLSLMFLSFDFCWIFRSSLSILTYTPPTRLPWDPLYYAFTLCTNILCLIEAKCRMRQAGLNFFIAIQYGCECMRAPAGINRRSALVAFLRAKSCK